MHGGPGADHWTMLPFRRLRRPVHARLLRPPLQRALRRRARLVDDVGEPDGRCRCAARAARVRALGGARPLVRRPRRPRVRAALSRQPVAPRPARYRRRQPLGAGERARAPRQARATARGRWRWPGASSTGRSRRRSSSRRSCGSAAPTTTTPASCSWPRDMIRGEWRTKTRPEALIFAGRHLLKGWTVMDRLGEITVPTLVMAGATTSSSRRSISAQLAAGIPERAPADHRARRPQPALRAARRGHPGGHGLPDGRRHRAVQGWSTPARLSSWTTMSSSRRRRKP